MAECPADLFLRWCAYASIEPWAEERADLRSGLIVSALTGKPATDFLLTPKPVKRQTWQQMKAVTDAMVAFGAARSAD